MFLLDTDICIALLNTAQHRGPAHRALLRQAPESVCLCSVVKAELLFGARHSQRVEANLAVLTRFFAPLRSLPFDDAAAEDYGLIRATLAASGTLIGPNDLLIAAIARRHDATLVTHNRSEFARVPGLRWVEVPPRPRSAPAAVGV